MCPVCGALAAVAAPPRAGLYRAAANAPAFAANDSDADTERGDRERDQHAADRLR
jgi:hypothetical protein